MLNLFDGLEIHRFIEEDGELYSTAGDIDFKIEDHSDSKIVYSLQGHLITGGTDDIADFQNEELASEVAQCINDKMKYKHGINLFY